TPHCCILASAPSLDIAFFINCFDCLALINALDLSIEPARTPVAQRDRIESKRHFGLARSFARTSDFGDVPRDGRIGIIARIEHCRGESIALAVGLSADR